MDVEFRPAVSKDARAATRLLTGCFPHLPVTPRQVRSRLIQTDAEDTARHVAGYLGDRLVAWERVAVDQENRSALVIVVVDPEFRGLGIGSTLLNDATDHAARAGAVTLHAPTLEDETTRRFCSRRGWQPNRWTRFLSTDLTPLAELGAPLPPAGVEVVPGWMIEHPESIYEMHSECLIDEPRDTPPPPQIDYLRWVNEIWRGTGGHDTTESSVVSVNGQPVSFAMFDMDPRSGRIWSTFTGTRRGWRGQGFAALAKATMLQRAAERGIHTAWTVETVGNLPMAAVNARLGFAPALTQVTIVRHLTDS